MANIYDVAKLAGVSRSAVSRVLNNQKGVHPDKRALVLKAVKELNYRPNSMARGLALKKTNTIGIITRELADSFYSEFIRSLNYHADQHNYGALYCVRNNYLTTNVDYLTTLSAKVDGYIFLGENTVSEKELQGLVDVNIPVIGMEFNFGIKGIAFLTIDNYEEALKGMNYLIKQGHKKIIHVGLDSSIHEFKDREKGYQDAIFSHELKYSKVYRGDYVIGKNIALGKEIGKDMEREGASAIFCANDTVAVGIKEGLRQAGYAEDIEILGFDGLYVNEDNALPITKFSTIKQPQDLMGRYAIDTMIKLINDEKDDYSKVFTCELIRHKRQK